MRKLKSSFGDTTINVVRHVILKNFWEYYVTDRDCGNVDLVEALVIGFETEIGDVYLPEIRPYIISETRDLNEVMPAPNWEWIDEPKERK